MLKVYMFVWENLFMFVAANRLVNRKYKISKMWKFGSKISFLWFDEWFLLQMTEEIK